MDAWVWIVLVVVVVVVAALLYARSRKQRTDRLRGRFGPEYERAVSESGKRSAAESELLEREKRREQLHISPLEPEARERYTASWQEVQASFVDAPSRAISEADRLVAEVMRERGYPLETFDQREADISVDHPEVVQDYRAAHAISLANDHGEASTEDLRQAMVHYRSLFSKLLENGKDRAREAG
jgi:hypothetical protein